MKSSNTANHNDTDNTVNVCLKQILLLIVFGAIIVFCFHNMKEDTNTMIDSRYDSQDTSNDSLNDSGRPDNHGVAIELHCDHKMQLHLDNMHYAQSMCFVDDSLYIVATPRKESEALPCIYEFNVDDGSCIDIVELPDTSIHGNSLTYNRKDNTLVFIGRNNLELMSYDLDNHMVSSTYGYSRYPLSEFTISEDGSHAAHIFSRGTTIYEGVHVDNVYLPIWCMPIYDIGYGISQDTTYIEGYISILYFYGKSTPDNHTGKRANKLVVLSPKTAWRSCDYLLPDICEEGQGVDYHNGRLYIVDSNGCLYTYSFPKINKKIERSFGAAGISIDCEALATKYESSNGICYITCPCIPLDMNALQNFVNIPLRLRFGDKSIYGSYDPKNSRVSFGGFVSSNTYVSGYAEIVDNSFLRINGLSIGDLDFEVDSTQNAKDYRKSFFEYLDNVPIDALTSEGEVYVGFCGSGLYKSDNTTGVFYTGTETSFYGL